MNKLTIAVTGIACAAAIGVPAGLALASAPSTDRSATTVRDDHGAKGGRHGADDRTKAPATPTATGTTVTPSASRTVEPGDDHGRRHGRHTEAGDDRGGRSSEAGDDRGGRSSEPGDDRGGRSSETGDDRGGHGAEAGDDHGNDGSGSDDGGHHGHHGGGSDD